MEILIGGEKQPVMTDSLNFEDEVDNRAVANFAVKDIYNEKEFFRGQPVTIKNDNEKEVFKGYIETTDKRPITNAGSYIHDITCSDMHYLADKRMVAFAEKEVLPGDMAKKIVDDKLEEEGVRYFDNFEKQDDLSEENLYLCEVVE